MAEGRCDGRGPCAGGICEARCAGACVNTDNDPVLTNPEAVDVTLDVVKTYTPGKAAIAPNGQPYKTNFADDSVRARNYIGHLQKA